MFPLKQNGIAKKKVFFTVHMHGFDDNGHQNIFIISFDIIMF